MMLVEPDLWMPAIDKEMNATKLHDKILTPSCHGRYPLVYRHSRLYSCNEYLIRSENKGLSRAILLLVIHSHRNHAISDDGVVRGHFSMLIGLAGTSKGTVGTTNLCRVSHPCFV